ncbi:cytidine deaminase [Ferrimonas balearica]|uniref:cytidine deaminase n=1 Tax=Ferrimonas balearica TaxID=44012 RepID=UPI001C9689C6|nr:cytidine deaminase [Ferrimonas balearica]MBY5979272.1 cytidine deaminase [Ferrimonas balearica]
MATPFDTALTQIPAELAAALTAHLPQPFTGKLSPQDVAALEQASGMKGHDLLLAMLPLAACFSQAPVSHFEVGAIARGISGTLYFGANLELAGEALFHSVHAEQSAISHAWLAGEAGLTEIVVNASPCGHCRQFMNELNGADELIIVLPGQDNGALHHYLPYAFGPSDLGVEVGLMAASGQALQLESDDALVNAALAAARLSYAPYSHSPSAVALQCQDGQVFVGRYAENAAFNPSLPPMQMALADMARHRVGFDRIQRAVLVELDDAQISQATAARAALAAISDVELAICHAK